MRLVIVALLALVAVATPAAASCPGSGPPPISTLPCAIAGIGCSTPPPVSPPGGLPSLPPADPPLSAILGPGSTTNNYYSTTNSSTTNNFVTNNTVTNVTNTTAAAQSGSGTSNGTTTAASGTGSGNSTGNGSGTGTPPTTTASAPTAGGGGFSGGGGAGGGGIGGGGGFSGGSSGVGGMPINPSSDFTYPLNTFASSGSGGGSAAGDPVTVASLGSPIGGAFASSGGSDGPLTPGVTVATLPPVSTGPDSAVTVAMASPKTDGAASPDTSSGFGLDGPAFAGVPLPSGYSGTTILAALIGVGVLGAGWAWKSLVV